MGRPFTASDEDIMQAASRVVARRGPDGFSIAEVAADVGLSRGAIILRFKSTHALKVTLLSRLVEQFAAEMATLPQSPSGDNILRLAAYIGARVGSRESSASFLVSYSINVQDAELLALEVKRGQALCGAIARVMPPTAIDHAAAVTAFMAHLTGSVLAWVGMKDDNPKAYMVRRARDWLMLAQISFSEELVQDLCDFLSTSSEHKRRSGSFRRKKAKLGRANER